MDDLIYDSMLGGGSTAFICLLSLIGLAFWIWMLVDCVTKEPSEGNDKVVWILVIVLAGVIGAFIYLVVRIPKRIRKHGK